MKYIDADRLKVEIEKHIKEVKDAAERFTPNMGFFDAKLSGIYDVMALLDTLSGEDRTEPYNPHYDEAYLKEKIAKASKSWKGVDVDKFIDNVRGRESSESLEEAAYKYSFDSRPSIYGQVDVIDAFKAGAEWQKAHANEDTAQVIAMTARHFAEWGAEHAKTPTP
jgi:hypothetical protein